MGQVPPHYGILGDGRVARHFSHYLKLEELPHSQWARKSSLLTAKETLEAAEVILILVNDRAIEQVISENPFLSKKRLVHFSGSHVSERAAGMHPLMSFATELYPLENYRSFPFVVEDGFDFKDFFPTLQNRAYPIQRADKALYHALCVLGGNISAILWNKLICDLGRLIDLPREAVFPFLNQVTNNIEKLAEGAVTGPLTRGDTVTIERNLAALGSDPFATVYRSAADIYLKGAL